MASIRKMPNGTYKAEVYMGRDANGKKIREYVTRDTQKECLKAARELEMHRDSGDISKLTKMKMSDYMDTWLGINKAFLSSTTVKAYKMYIEHHFKPYFGNMRVDQVTDMHIKKYLSEKLETLSPTTVRKHYFTLSKMLSEALKGNNPCVGIKPPKNANFKPILPTEKEYYDIVDRFAKEGIQDELIVLLAGCCGLRRGEIFALRWNDIDFKLGTIRIDEAVALEAEGYDFLLKEPKSDNGIRTVAAPEDIMKLLSTWQQTRTGKNNVIALKNNNDLIFTYNPHSFTKKYARIIRDTDELPKVRFHDLRHYHASLLYKNNVPDQYAAERLGHDVMVLKRIYQHLGLEEKHNLDEKIKGMFKRE